MELLNDFRVPVSAGEAWNVLTDVERIAPMLPGAQLQEVEGDEYRGIVKVKVGPITAQYKGTAKFLEQSESTGKVVLFASGRDTRGQGNASATITATMTPDGEGTHVQVVTDLSVSGKVAQFGRSVLADVSTKLLGQFADALEADLAASGNPEARGETPVATSEPDSGRESEPRTAVRPNVQGDGNAAPSGPIGSPGDAASASSGPRRIVGPEAEPVDLLALGGASTMRRLGPPIGVGIILLVLLLGLRRRRRRRRDA
jgi:carbon monoxide dehydrogenase subunit G